MSAAGQQMALLKSFRTKSSGSRPEPVPKAKPPPLPPCPKPPHAEKAADMGDPYGGQRGAIFKCSIRGFQKWYDKQTWNFFEEEDLLYLAHSPRTRSARMRTKSESKLGQSDIDSSISSSAPGSPGRRVKKAANEGAEGLNVRDLSNLLKDAKNGKLSKKQKKKLIRKELQMRQQQSTREKRERNVPKEQKKSEVEKYHISTASTLKHTPESPPIPSENKDSRNSMKNNNESSGSSASDRLTHAISIIKALRVHVDAIDAGDIAAVSKAPCTESELNQAVSLILKLCGSFSSHAWSVARSGCVGAIATVVNHHLGKTSMTPWISDALSTISLIVGLLFDAQKNGSKKGLKRSLKPELVNVASIAAVIAATSPAAGGVLCKNMLEASIRLLHVLCDEMCGVEPLIMDLHEDGTDEEMPRGRRDFLSAGGLHALLLVGMGEKLWSETTKQGKSCRVLLKRFSVKSLKAVRDDTNNVRSYLAESTEHCTEDMFNTALDKELSRRMRAKNRSSTAANIQRAYLPGSKEDRQEKALADLARREKLQKYNMEQSQKAQQAREAMTKRIQQAAREREDQQIKMMEEREALLDARRTELVKKRAELDRKKQAERLKKMEKLRREAEELAAVKLKREEDNQASYEKWKATKEARKEEESRRRAQKRQKEHDANMKMLQDLQSRLKENIERRNKLEYEVPKAPSPPDAAAAPEGGRFERSYHVNNTKALKIKKKSRKSAGKKAERYSPREDMERFFSKAPKGTLADFEGLSVVGLGGIAK